jgi:putative N-acetyltransferase (TIGR04045 family)
MSGVASPNAVFQVRLAAQADEIRAARALRHQVFCIEQALFTSDVDAIDAHATTLVAILAEAGQVIGTVRIHAAGKGLWFGSRLAVAPPWRRRAGLGPALIRSAVEAAEARGCRRFLAHVQAANVALFESLDWQALETCLLHGMPHCLMQAPLSCAARGTGALLPVMADS